MVNSEPGLLSCKLSPGSQLLGLRLGNGMLVEEKWFRQEIWKHRITSLMDQSSCRPFSPLGPEPMLQEMIQLLSNLAPELILFCDRMANTKCIISSNFFFQLRPNIFPIFITVYMYIYLRTHKVLICIPSFCEQFSSKSLQSGCIYSKIQRKIRPWILEFQQFLKKFLWGGVLVCNVKWNAHIICVQMVYLFWMVGGWYL